MQRSDFDRFSLALTACAELYGKTVSEGALSLWWQALQRYDIEQVETAFRRQVEDSESGQWMPKPADLIKRMDGTATDRSLIAWGKVLDAAQRVGAYQSVAFDDGVIHAVIEDLGGWPNVCRAPTDELPFVQRRFTEAYRAYGQRSGLSYPAQLAGEHDIANAPRAGFKPSPPVLVGDPAIAKRVLQDGAAGAKTQITRIVDALPKKLS